MEKPMPSMYCAMPTRMRERTKEIEQFAWNQGFVPIMPFNLGPYEYTEGNPRFGRERALALTKGVQLLCGEVGVFGISEGVLGEVKHALAHGQPLRFYRQFDPHWVEFYNKLSDSYGDPLCQNRLFLFVGPSAVGKTHWTEHLEQKFGTMISRVRSTTTRKERINNASDKKSYRFISRDQFRKELKGGAFLEHASYLGNLYGSSWSEVEKVLARQHGIMAVETHGAHAFYEHRDEVNPCFILLKPKSLDVLRLNLKRRGIHKSAQQKKYLKQAEKFVLPEHIPHIVIEIEGDNDLDRPKIENVVCSRMIAESGF